MIGILAALNTWESFSCLLLIGVMFLLLHRKTETRYLTLPFFIAQMEHFDTLHTQQYILLTQ